jgi:hypothetical protein
MSNANILNLRQSMILGDELKNLKKKSNAIVVGKKKNPWNPFSKNVYTQQNKNTVNAKIQSIRNRFNKSRKAEQARRNARMAGVKPVGAPAAAAARRTRRRRGARRRRN